MKGIPLKHKKNEEEKARDTTFHETLPETTFTNNTFDFFKLREASIQCE